MQVLSLVWGILSGVGFMIGLTPCLGALNWVNIPFALIGCVISGIALGTAQPNQPKGMSIAGLIICILVVVFGGIRLVLGGGVV